MATLQEINVGAAANDDTGDPLRTAFQKVNANDEAINDELADKLTEDDVGVEIGDLVRLVDQSGTPGFPTGISGSGLTGLPGGGDMAAATYDPQAIAGDAFARANHTGTQAASTIGSGTLADARIAASNVTQHQAALSIAYSQLTSLAIVAGDLAAAIYASESDATTATENTKLITSLTARQGTAAYAEPKFSTIEEDGDYSVTPYVPIAARNTRILFTGAQDQIVTIPAGLEIGSNWVWTAPDANTLDIRRVDDSGVSINGIAANGALAGNAGIVPAGGEVYVEVIDTNTIRIGPTTLALQLIPNPVQLGDYLDLDAQTIVPGAFISVSGIRSYTDADSGKRFRVTTAGTQTVPNTVPDGWSVEIRNRSAGSLNIDGGGTPQALAVGEVADVTMVGTALEVSIGTSVVVS